MAFGGKDALAELTFKTLQTYYHTNGVGNPRVK